MDRKIGFYLVVLCLLFSLGAEGCWKGNIFSIIDGHKAGESDDPEVLISDAESAMSKENYEEAATYYQNAIDNSDPDNAIALYGHAKATLKANEFDLIGIVNSFISGEGNAADLLIPSQEEINNIIEVSETVVDNLKQIADGNTDGSIPADNAAINFDLGVYMAIDAVVGMTDSDEDGDYDDNDIIGTKEVGGQTDITLTNGDGDTKTFEEINAMTEGEWTAFEVTLDTQTIVLSLNDAINKLSESIAYVEKGLGSTESTEVAAIKDAIVALKSRFEDMKTKLEG